MAESRYNLRRTLHPTPKSKINQTALARRKTRKRTASPSPSPTPPLPPQPDFGITSAPESFDMDTGEGSSGQFDDLPASDGVCETIEQGPDTEDNGVDSAVAEVDYWLGAAVLYSAPPIPAGILQESGHSSGIPVESIGIPLEFHWNKNGIRLKYSFI